MTAPVFINAGKQIMRRGAHFADACDERAAEQIALALNLVLETPADQPLTAPRAAEPKPVQGD